MSSNEYWEWIENFSDSRLVGTDAKSRHYYLVDGVILRINIVDTEVQSKVTPQRNEPEDNK